MAKLQIEAKNHTNTANDTFVGIKLCTNEKDQAIISATFPLGYSINNEHDEQQRALKKQTLSLINAINHYNKSYFSINQAGTNSQSFPFDAYISIIKLFIENGYYTQNVHSCKQAGYGKINWKRTIKSSQPIIQNNNSITFAKYMVSESKNNNDALISLVHKWCVYEAFKKLGWLFTDYTVAKPAFNAKEHKTLAAATIQNALKNTFNDKHKQLFSAMLAMLNHTVADNENTFSFGTNRFEYVWEYLIDNTFGIQNKNSYFPPYSWSFKENKYRLLPDTIMQFNNSTFVLDAKYYGYVLDSSRLPGAADISKQIVYGEFAQAHENKHLEAIAVFTAFLIPYDFSANPHNLCYEQNAHYHCIGHATSCWNKLSGAETYHKVPAVLLDTKWLLTSNGMVNKKELAKVIQDEIHNAQKD